MNPRAEEWKPSINASEFVPAASSSSSSSPVDSSSTTSMPSETIMDENEDWIATKFIYNEQPSSEILQSTGFVGSIDIPIVSSLKKMIFFRKVSQEGHFRFFSLASTSSSSLVMTLQLDFVYNYKNNSMESTTEKDYHDDDDTISSSPLPSLVRIKWKEVPSKDFFLGFDQRQNNKNNNQAEEFIFFLTEECNRRLSSSRLGRMNHNINNVDVDNDQDESMSSSSYAICDYCEHEALSHYFSRSIFYQDDEESSAYQMIQLPDAQDHLYHYNIGRLIHPKELARQKKQQKQKQKTKQQRHSKRHGSRCNSDECLTSESRCSGAVCSVKKTMPTYPPKRQSPELEQTQVQSKQHETIEEFAERILVEQWERLYQTSCPICMDENLCYSEGVTLPSCQHFVCLDCFDMYLKHIINNDLYCANKNPFLCPIETCRRSLPIFGKKFLKQYLSTEDMDRIYKWYKDIKNPPCFSLDQCISPTCRAQNSMRRKPPLVVNHNGKGQKLLSSSQYGKDTDIYCEVCHKMWCELCLKRLYCVDDDNHGATGPKLRHKDEECDPTTAVCFVQRYLAASPAKKELCQQKYPWISSYAHSRDLDLEATKWVSENGQLCPECGAGVERSEGCFHMKCAVCETHFCYECGDQIFPPYYGTHHCWEEAQNRLLDV